MNEGVHHVPLPRLSLWMTAQSIMRPKEYGHHSARPGYISICVLAPLFVCLSPSFLDLETRAKFIFANYRLLLRTGLLRACGSGTDLHDHPLILNSSSSEDGLVHLWFHSLFYQIKGLKLIGFIKCGKEERWPQRFRQNLKRFSSKIHYS